MLDINSLPKLSRNDYEQFESDVLEFISNMIKGEIQLSKLQAKVFPGIGPKVSLTPSNEEIEFLGFVLMSKYLEIQGVTVTTEFESELKNIRLEITDEETMDEIHPWAETIREKIQKNDIETLVETCMSFLQEKKSLLDEEDNEEEENYNFTLFSMVSGMKLAIKVYCHPANVLWFVRKHKIG